MPLIFRLPPGQGALSRLLSALVLIAIATVAFLLGAALFLVILGAVVLLAIALYLRFWWLRRQVAKQPQPSPRSGVTLEGEYTVAKAGKKARSDDRA
jgi:O-antigen/teichoic acid export membrane protein